MQTTVKQQSHPPKTTETTFKAAIAAAAVLGIALALAWIVQKLQAPWMRQQQDEKAVAITAILCALILAAVPGIYLLRAGRQAEPQKASLAFLSALSVVLLGIYFFWVRWYVVFPADIWIWSEGDFVNDMLKFSAGYPLYSAPANHDSFAYGPGPQLLTYLLAWIAGKAGSIPAYRVIQVGYTAAAAFMATLCCRRILRLAWLESRASEGWLWNIFRYATLFLIATNAITNRFTHNLHGDALAQLASITAYYRLLVYVEKRSRLILAAMIVLAPIGFLIKQSLLIWGGLYGGFLTIWGQSWKRLAVYAMATAVLSGAVIAACYAIWGYPFYYWVLYLFRHHPVSPLRSFQHVLDTWVYFSAGLLGGLAVLHGRKPDALLGAWLVSLGLIVAETYTSGIAWMLNHIGPGCLLAGVWFLAGLATVWDEAVGSWKPAGWEGWIRAAAVTAALALVFNGMGLVRIPLQPVSGDAYRYVHDIEKQFEGQPPGKVLLDVGTWVYLKDRVIMGDRASAIGEEGYASSGDFSGFRSRIGSKRYSKILVRGLHQPVFWYDSVQWPKSLGLRTVLLDNYRETGTIRRAEAPKDLKKWSDEPYLFDEISILEPRNDAPAK